MEHTTEETTLEPCQRFGESALTGNAGQALALAHSPSGKRVAVLGYGSALDVVDVEAGRVLTTLALRNGKPCASFDGEDAVVVCDARGVVRLEVQGGGERVLVPALTLPYGDFREADAHVSGPTIAVLDARGDGPECAYRVRLFVQGALSATVGYELAGMGLGALSDPRFSPRFALNATALSPDGSRLVSLGAVLTRTGGTLRNAAGLVLVHDAQGRLLHASKVPSDAVFLGSESSYFSQRITFSPSGKRFAVSHTTQRVFDGETGALLHLTTLELHGDPLSAQRSAMLDDDTLLVATETHLVRQAVGQEKLLAHAPYDEQAFVLALSVGGDSIALSDNRALLLFSLSDLSRQHRPEGHLNAVPLLAVDRAGTRVVSGDGQTLMGWDSLSGSRRFRVASRAYLGIAYAPDDTELMVAHDGRLAHVLSAETGAVRARGEAGARAIAWGKEPTCLEAAEVVRRGKVVAELVVGRGREARVKARLASDYLRCVPALSREGERALVWCEMRADGWDLVRGEKLWSQPHDLVCAALSPDGAYAVVHRISAPPALLDMANGKVLVELETLGGSISSAVAWSPARDLLALGRDDGDVWLVELDVAALEKRSKKGALARATRLQCGHVAGVSAVAFSADGSAVATAGMEGRVLLFRPTA